jgi:tRNA-splicing ligase RtcB
MKFIKTGNAPIKAWIEGVQVEEKALQQLSSLAQLPFIYKHIAAMPDVHWGIGATIGSVIATKNAVIPAAVGVDIGCGMIAQRTTLTASDLPDSLLPLRLALEAAIPHGRTDNGGINDQGAWKEPSVTTEQAFGPLHSGLQKIVGKYSEILRAASRACLHLGTLGGGNHFVEICLDENQHVWVMLHSGSRGIGNRIGTFFIEKAKKEMERYFINLSDKNLAYLVEGSDLFNDYVEAVGWAQSYASVNRLLMMNAVLKVLEKIIPKPFKCNCSAVNCHHNYVNREFHFGSQVLLTRKGAVSARKGELGIIPGSMGAKSFIVEGKGNADSFCSCSHGAGRVMGRIEAKQKFTIEDHKIATKNVECRKDAEVIDETPGAYKDIDTVMAAQSDLVSIRHTLRQVVCVKG